MKRYRIRVNKRKLRVVEIVLAAVMLVAVTMLGITLAGYWRDRAAYAEARSLAVSAPTATPTAAATAEPAATPVPAPAETPPIAVDFAAIRQTGRHVRGWLYLADTIVNYPVVYYVNNEYYLTRDYTGKRNSAGALFFDTRVGEGIAGDNLVIYGHHMKDGSMFKSLLYYQKQEYYEQHPTMYLLTLAGNYRVDLFAARFTDSDPANFPIWFSGEEEKEAFFKTATAQSDFTPADNAFRPDGRMLSLVTCAYSRYIDDAKYVVYGWLSPIG